VVLPNIIYGYKNVSCLSSNNLKPEFKSRWLMPNIQEPFS